MVTTLVTGGTGRVGGAVLASFVEAGYEPIALVRARDRIKAIPVSVPARIADLTRPDEVAQALTSVDRILLSSAHDPRMLEIQRNLISAAKDAGVKRIVKISGSPAASFEGTPSRVVQQHLEIEAALVESGIEHTNIRPNAFTQLIAGNAGEIADGHLRLALGDAALSWVDVHDIAAVAVAALVTDEPLPVTIEVTGPEALTGDELAATLAEYTGNNVSYVPISDDESRERVRSAGAPDWLIEHVAVIFSLLRERNGGQVSEMVEEWRGSPACSVASVLDREGADLGIKAAATSVDR